MKFLPPSAKSKENMCLIQQHHKVLQLNFEKIYFIIELNRIKLISADYGQLYGMLMTKDKYVKLALKHLSNLS